jgi:hypothetical protein
VFERLTIGQLLERWRTELIGAGVVERDAWDHYRPAASDDLDSAERRLGRSLPPTYREFLSVSDGWPAGSGIVTGLRSASSVGWFRDIESEWYQIWRDIAVAEDPNELGFDVELMGRALVVSEPAERALLLDPDDFDAGTGEWACYTFSNWAPGASAVGRSFRAGLEHVYRSSLADQGVESVALVEASNIVERAYQAMLAGDLHGRALLEEELRLNWRAWLLAAQFDAFGAQPYASDFSTSVNHLWWGSLGGVTTEEALADQVLMNDLLPLYVVRLIEAGLNIDWEIHRAPDAVAARMRAHRAQISAGTGLLADFSYAPRFADKIEGARRQVVEGDLDAAWETVQAALPTWAPMSPHHLAPLGLYYDMDLRRLLTPPPQPTLPSPPTTPAGGHRVLTTTGARSPATEPANPATVVALSNRRQHSDRTLAVLQTPFRPTATP